MRLEAASPGLTADTDETVLVHVGLHKTGTTWLQQRVFKALDGQAIAYCGDLDVIYRELIVPEIADFSATRAREAFEDLLQSAKAANRLPVISGESLAGRPFHAKFHRAVVAERIAAVFPNARILLTLREQSAIIRSMYGQYVRFGYTSSIRQFLKQPPPGSSFSPVLNMSFYDYAKLIEEYRRVFAPERIIAMPSERLIADPAWAMEILSQGTGFALPKDLPQAKSGERANPALSGPAYYAVRTANRFISQDARWQSTGGLNPNAVGYWVDRLTPRGVRRRMDARLTQIVTQEIGDFYKASNREASKAIGIDLGKFGYAV